MYTVTYLESPIDIFENLVDFLYARFDFFVDNNTLNIRDKNYKIFVDKDYKKYRYSSEFSEEELILDYVASSQFTDFCRSHFYKIYKIKSR